MFGKKDDLMHNRMMLSRSGHPAAQVRNLMLVLALVFSAAGCSSQADSCACDGSPADSASADADPNSVVDACCGEGVCQAPAPEGEEPVDVHLIGSGLDTYDGEIVRVIVEPGGSPRPGIAESKIIDGTFNILWPVSGTSYTAITAYVDSTRDDVCRRAQEPHGHFVTSVTTFPEATTVYVCGDPDTCNRCPETFPDMPCYNLDIGIGSEQGSCGGAFVDTSTPMPCPDQ